MKFYVGGTLVYAGSHFITPAYDGQAPIRIGRRPSAYDNVVVTAVDPVIPTVSEWGLGVMLLAKLVEGSLVLRRRRIPFA